MSPDDIKTLLNVQADAFQRTVEMMMKENKEKIYQMEVTVKNLEKKYAEEIRILRDSLEFTQREVDEYKELLKDMKKDKDNNTQKN